MKVIFNKLSKHKKYIRLGIGEFYLAKNPSQIWTNLGSCVAIIFHNKRLEVGAIAHAELPQQPACNHDENNYRGCCFIKTADHSACKYVACSFRYMLERFHMLGIQNVEIDVKIFGGARMLVTDQNKKTVGEQNIEAALKMVKEYKLNLVSKNIGGNCGRNIYFHSDSGKVFLRRF